MKRENDRLLDELLEENTRLKSELQDKSLVFENILEGSMAGYWDWYIKDNYEYLSPRFKSMFGYEDHEMENHPDEWQKIIHPDDLPGVFELFNKHVESKGRIPFDNEVRYYHKNGNIVWVYCRGKVVEWDEEGNPVRMVGSHVDITAIKNFHAMEKRANELIEINRALEQFSYIASHDLQEPLRTVLSFSEKLKQDTEYLDAKSVKYAEFIHNSANRMSLLIKGLLDYSRIGKEEEISEFSLTQTISEIVEDLDSSIHEAKAIVKFDTLPIIRGKKTMIRLAFQNLLSNALKFKSEDRPPMIRIDYSDDTKNWKFSVEDNGIGIEEKHLEKIFMIFQRLHLKDEFEGTGIGLAHCQKIINLHGGEIWAESTFGEGTSIHMTIPKQL